MEIISYYCFYFCHQTILTGKISIVKKEPHYSQPSREGATPSNGKSPLA